MSTQIADIKIKISGGGDVQNVLGAVRQGTLSVRDAQLALKNAVREHSQSVQAGAQIAAWAARDGLKDLRLLAESQRNINAQLITNEMRAKGFAKALKGAANHALEAFNHISKMAGVRTFEQMQEQGNKLEEALERARISMNITKAEWEKLGAKKLIFDVADKSGKPVLEVVQGLRQVQNETSRGRDMLANGGRLLETNAAFGLVTEGTTGDTAVTSIKAARAFGITLQDQDKIPGLLFQQHIQGSLTGKDAQKFVGEFANYQLLSGNRFKGEGREIRAFAEFMAMANIIKDTGGMGSGDEGAAKTRTALGGLLRTLAKGKGFSAKDHSSVTMMQEAFGKDFKFRDESGFIDIPKMLEGLEKYKGKVGDAKFSQWLRSVFREQRGFQGVQALLTSRIRDKGKENSLEALSKPDIDAGTGHWKEAHEDLRQTAEVKNTLLENKEAENVMTGQAGRASLLQRFRAWYGGWKSQNMGAAAVLDTGLPQAAVIGGLGVGGKIAAGKYLAGKGLAGMLSAGVMGAIAGGLAITGAVKYAGLLAGKGETTDDIIGRKLGESAGEGVDSNGTPQSLLARLTFGLIGAPAVSKGNKGHAAYMASMSPDKATREQGLAGLAVIAQMFKEQKPPVVNVYIDTQSGQARVVPEAKTSQQLAQSGPTKAHAPGRR